MSRLQAFPFPNPLSRGAQIRFSNWHFLSRPPWLDGGQAAMSSTWASCWETNGCCRVQQSDAGQLPEHRVFLLFAAQHTLLATVKGRAVLPARECFFFFVLHSRSSPQIGLYVQIDCIPCRRPMANRHCCHYPSFSRKCPTGLDLTVQKPDCSRDAPMRGFPEE